MPQSIRTVLILLLAGLALVARAESDPRQVVENAIDRLTSSIEENREEMESDPAKARELVRDELADLVDFKRITRMVMGDHFANASRDQKYRFLDVFKSSLINTYASGITLYDGQKIKVLPVRESDRKGDYARVRMQLNTNAGKVVPIYYTLYQRDDQWRVINVYVNGLDLRDTFKSQFAQGMEEYQDMDTVIDNWAADAEIDTGLEDKVEQQEQQ